VTQSQFVDDLALHTTERTGLEVVTKTLVEEIKKWGLKVNVEKTKGIVLGNL